MSGYNFGYFDPATTTTTVICTSDDLWNGCAIAADGYIYAITSEGKLIKVDKNNVIVMTGKITLSEKKTLSENYRP